MNINFILIIFKQFSNVTETMACYNMSIKCSTT